MIERGRHHVLEIVESLIQLWKLAIEAANMDLDRSQEKRRTSKPLYFPYQI